MECKIGEIRKVGNKWLQCIESACNKECYFYNRSLHKTIAGIDGNDFGACNACLRSDNKSVIFKELEKIGEPYDDCGIILQRFKIYTNVTNADTKGLELHIYSNDTIGIEIKENKENMEEKNLKPFDLEAAKAGKPVCTRDGRKAKVWNCTLANKNFPVVAIVSCGQEENVYQYDANGVCDEHDENLDLMMLPEKRSGWIVLRKDTELYDSEEAAKNDCVYDSCVPVRVEFEI